MSPNPIGHIAGIYAALIAPFRCGYKKLVLVDGFDPRWMLELIAQHKVTRSGGAPIFMQVMLNDPEFANIDTSSLQLFGVGGANVAPSLIEQADSVGWWSMRSYGCTEHPSITMGTGDDPLQKRAYTDGRPMLDVEIRLVDDDGEGGGCRRGGRGRARAARTSSSATWIRRWTPRRSTTDGWFHTGDIGRVDADGYLSITDRKKDIIIRGGENISAREVEEALAKHPKVQESAVTPVPTRSTARRSARS